MPTHRPDAGGPGKNLAHRVHAGRGRTAQRLVNEQAHQCQLGEPIAMASMHATDPKCATAITDL